MTEWNLRARSHTCSKCNQPLTDGERCHSAVSSFESPAVQTLLADKIAAAADSAAKPKPQDYVRLDFCPACWPEMRPSDWISTWHSPYAAPEPPTPEALPRETAESLLRKLMEQEDSVDNTSVIFILAVMLERKKIIIERTIRRNPDGTMVRVYENKKTGEVMLIIDPDLQMDEIPEVQKKVQELLEPPQPAPESAPTPQDATAEGGPDASATEGQDA